MKQLVGKLIDSGYLKTAVIIDAFLKIDRKDFVNEDLASRGYDNAPLPIGFGQTISQPLTVAFMLELLKQNSGDKILDVGSGSGWTTALLSYIVGKQGKVIALERIKELKKWGEHNTDKYGFVKDGIAEFYVKDGSRGFAERAPYDKILVSAAADEISDELVRQLKKGGRLVMPIRNSIKLIRKISEKCHEEKEYFGFSFVPLIKD